MSLLLGLGAAATALLALVALWRATRPFRGAVARWHRRLGESADLIIGYPPIVDPATGRELRPAVPGIGERVGRVEESLEHVVAGALEEARNAARASARAAASAEESALAARFAATTATAQIGELRELLSEWQNVDRTRVESLTAVVTELGIDTEFQHPDPPSPQHPERNAS